MRCWRCLAFSAHADAGRKPVVRQLDACTKFSTRLAAAFDGTCLAQLTSSSISPAGSCQTSRGHNIFDAGLLRHHFPAQTARPRFRRARHHYDGSKVGAAGINTTAITYTRPFPAQESRSYMSESAPAGTSFIRHGAASHIVDRCVRASRAGAR